MPFLLPPKRLLDPRIIGVYAIHGPRGRSYVGSSINVKSHQRSYQKELKRGKGPQKMRRDWERYGRSAFAFEILEVCDFDDLQRRERYWCRRLKAVTHGYCLAEPRKRPL